MLSLFLRIILVSPAAIALVAFLLEPIVRRSASAGGKARLDRQSQHMEPLGPALLGIAGSPPTRFPGIEATVGRWTRTSVASWSSWCAMTPTRAYSHDRVTCHGNRPRRRPPR